MKMVDTRCPKCEKVFVDVIVERDNSDYPKCCGKRTKWMPTKLITTEWGGPRHYPHLRDQPFESRSDLASWAKANNMALGASAEKVGGARNEEHLNTGRIYSYAK